MRKIVHEKNRLDLVGFMKNGKEENMMIKTSMNGIERLDKLRKIWLMIKFKIE